MFRKGYKQSIRMGRIQLGTVDIKHRNKSTIMEAISRREDKPGNKVINSWVLFWQWIHVK